MRMYVLLFLTRELSRPVTKRRIPRPQPQVIKLLNVEAARGNTRVFFVSGQRAIDMLGDMFDRCVCVCACLPLSFAMVCARFARMCLRRYPGANNGFAFDVCGDQSLCGSILPTLVSASRSRPLLSRVRLSRLEHFSRFLCFALFLCMFCSLLSLCCLTQACFALFFDVQGACDDQTAELRTAPTRGPCGQVAEGARGPLQSESKPGVCILCVCMYVCVCAFACARVRECEFLYSMQFSHMPNRPMFVP